MGLSCFNDNADGSFQSVKHLVYECKILSMHSQSFPGTNFLFIFKLRNCWTVWSYTTYGFMFYIIHKCTVQNVTHFLPLYFFLVLLSNTFSARQNLTPPDKVYRSVSPLPTSVGFLFPAPLTRRQMEHFLAQPDRHVTTGRHLLKGGKQKKKRHLWSCQV